MTEASPACAIAQIYEETLVSLLELARRELNNPTFGDNLAELAAMPFIPGLAPELADEVLHFARAVAKRRPPAA